MTRVVLRRLPSALLVLLLASIAIFAIVRLVPGDAAVAAAGGDATPETLRAVRADLGLDQPLLAQYAGWLHGFLTLDLGRSFVIGGDISDLIGQGATNTIVLAASALLVAVVVSLVLSVGVVLRPTRFVQALADTVITLGVALPPFVTGVLLTLIFAVWLPLLPSGGVPRDGLWAAPDITAQFLVLPAVCLGLPVAGVLTRFLTESLRTQVRQPYVLTARAAGLSRRRTVLAGVLRASLPTYVTVLGLQVGALIGGSVLVEAIFAWPGLGQLLQQAVTRRDYPVVQAVLLLSIAVFIVIQLLTDLAQAWLDPRIRLGARR